MEYLNSFLNYEQVTAYRYPEVFSLDRMERLLDRLGNPHRRYPTLHVAGTKGKGSTCAFAASILRAAGLRVGLYTSPHLITFRERFRINGRPIPEEKLAEVVGRIQPNAAPDLTFFEVTTACAFLYFAQERVDAAVVEVGLGGRLDATNLLMPEVTVITPISLDHMDKLGDTVEAIAREKAGIIKPGVPVVMASQPIEARRVFEETAVGRGAPLHGVEKEVRSDEVILSLEGTRCGIETPVRSYPDLQIPLLGRHQLSNAVAAIRAVELFAQRRGLSLTSRAVQEGLRQTEWPGRCQLIQGNPPILLDGAQNAASARVLKEMVAELFPGRRVTPTQSSAKVFVSEGRIRANE